MNYIDELKRYIPKNTQEESDLKIMLDWALKYSDNCLLRENTVAHFSASAWVVNKTMDKVLLNYHNLYKNWGWLGGHADGESDLLKVALKEVNEESGLKNIKPLIDDVISVEILPVTYHVKNNKFVSSHLHMNLTYLIVGDESEELVIKPDENSGLKWVKLEEVLSMTNEECMKPIYKKLNDYLYSIKESIKN